jgi:hypothetical protein
MAKITFYGLTPDHSLVYGINHGYIAKELSIKNWKKRAIVRNSKYIYIQKGEKFIKNDKNIIIFTVFINEHDDRHDFDTAEDAIDFANSYHNKEGTYPKQFEPGWHIGPVMKFPRKNQK